MTYFTLWGIPHRPWKIDAKMLCHHDFMFWSIFDRFLFSTSTPRTFKIIVFPNGKITFFQKIAFRSWDRFLMRFWCQLGSILPPQIDQNHQKFVLGVALGTPGLPLEASWAPLGGRMPKNIKKVTWRTPPQEVPKEVIFEHFSILFRVLFLVPVLVSFLATFWSPWELKKLYFPW